MLRSSSLRHPARRCQFRRAGRPQKSSPCPQGSIRRLPGRKAADIRAGISVDQVAAHELGSATSLPSLELGRDDNRMVGGCDSGYSCAYSNTISWSSPTTPLPLEANPWAVFERLFGDGGTTDPAARARMEREDASILDFVTADAARLSRKLPAAGMRRWSDIPPASVRAPSARPSVRGNPASRTPG